ncbi:MAG: hypothetical protein ACYC0X_05855 [Pirellulaceae bacterium]
MTRWTNWASVWLCLLCTFGVRCELAAQDWPQYGHDGSLTGRSPLAGKIESPHLSWSLSRAGRELVVEVTPSADDHSVLLSATAAVEAGSSEWSPSGPVTRDLEGRDVLRPAVETFHERWAAILPGVPGFQRVAWNFTWTDQKVCRLQLFAYDGGWDRPRLVWQTDPPEDTIFNPLNVLYDIDGDGVVEICVAAHYRVMVFEGTTGRKESELRYHSSRPYGWFGLADVDADGQQELVTIGDFQSHVDVVEYDADLPEPERLRVKWRRDIEQQIEERSKWPQVGPHPVANVAGDDRPEIVFNLFNDTGDGQWHVVVLDAATGDTVVDLPQRFMWGSRSLDGSSRESLFVSSSDGVLVHDMGRIELIQVEGRTSTVQWSSEASAWCLMEWPRLGANWSTTASQGLRQIALQGQSRPVFYAKSWHDEPGRIATISALRSADQGEIAEVWRVDGIPDSATVEVQDPDSPVNAAHARLRVRLAADVEATLSGRRATLGVIQNQPLGGDSPPPIVARLASGETRTVIVEAPGEIICAIDPPTTANGLPQVRWQQRGRGMRDGSRSLGLLAADLNGDRLSEVIAADAAAAGHAVLRVYRGDGSIEWEHPFPQVPGALPVWNVGGLTFWWPGQLRAPGTVDLFVNTRRGLMHSDIGQLLQGSDGAKVWQHDKAVIPDQFRWGWAGTPVAICDVQGDAREELICTYPVCFWVAEGATGELVAGCELASRKALPAWAAYGEPLVHDFNTDGKPEVLLDSPYILALLDVAGTPLWHGLPRIDFPVTGSDGNANETTPCKHALLDFDGDGRWEIASAGYGDGVRAIDPRDGRVLWALEAPRPTCPRTASTNIDGRGGDELLYVAGQQLVAITGDRQAGRILWTWTGTAPLSMPAIADVDGDGAAEIIVLDAQGVVQCLDHVGP